MPDAYGNRSGQGEQLCLRSLSLLIFVYFSDPRMAQNFTLASGGDDFSAAAKDSAVFYQTNVIESGATPRVKSSPRRVRSWPMLARRRYVAFFLFVPVFKIEDFPFCHPERSRSRRDDAVEGSMYLVSPLRGSAIFRSYPPFRLRYRSPTGWANFCSRLRRSMRRKPEEHGEWQTKLVFFQCSSGCRDPSLRSGFQNKARGLKTRLADSQRPIGTFTPLFFAKFLASSYPASTCLATPIPGSFVRTRSMRLAMASVPSATVTCPACCE